MAMMSTQGQSVCGSPIDGGSVQLLPRPLVQRDVVAVVEPQLRVDGLDDDQPLIVDPEPVPGRHVHRHAEGHDAEPHGVHADQPDQTVQLSCHDVRRAGKDPQGALPQKRVEHVAGLVQDLLALHPGTDRCLGVTWGLPQRRIAHEQMTRVVRGLEHARDNRRLVGADQRGCPLLDNCLVLTRPVSGGELPAPGPVTGLQAAQPAPQFG